MESIKDPHLKHKTSDCSKHSAEDVHTDSKRAVEAGPAAESRREQASSNSDDSGEAPERQTAVPGISRFAVREDGVLLLSLEEAAGRDLTGRRIVHLLELTDEEVAHARGAVKGALYAAAATIIGHLPRTTRE